MRRLSRYLLVQLSLPLAIALATCLFLGATSQALKLMRRSEFFYFPLDAWLRLAVYSLPFLASFVLPAAFLVALMATLGRLSFDGELLALSAAGISDRQLLRPLLAAASLIALIAGFAGLYGEPWGRARARSIFADLHGEALVQSLQPGSVTPVTPELWLAFPRASDGKLLIANRVAEGQHQIVAAGLEEMSYNPSHHTLELSLGKGELMSASSSGRYSRLNFDRFQLSLPLRNPAGKVELAELYPDELEGRIKRLRRSGSNFAHELVTREKKRAFPASAIAFALFALPLATRPKRGSSTQGYLVAAGVLLFYYLGVRAADGYAATRTFTFLPSMAPAMLVWLPNVVIALSGLLMLRSRSRGQT